jgi:hypothetical protein
MLGLLRLGFLVRTAPQPAHDLLLQSDTSMALASSDLRRETRTHLSAGERHGIALRRYLGIGRHGARQLLSGETGAELEIEAAQERFFRLALRERDDEALPLLFDDDRRREDVLARLPEARVPAPDRVEPRLEPRFVCRPPPCEAPLDSAWSAVAPAPASWAAPCVPCSSPWLGSPACWATWPASCPPCWPSSPTAPPAACPSPPTA